MSDEVENGHDCQCGEEGVDRALDPSLDDGERAVLLEHIRECPHCTDEVILVQTMRRLLHSACCHDQAPAELRRRISVSIETVRMQARG